MPSHAVVRYASAPGVSAPNYVPLPYSPVTLAEVGGNPPEVHGGTVYFSTDMQKRPLPTSEVHVGAMYFDPNQQTASTTAARSPVRRAKSAIPIVDPQVWFLTASNTVCILKRQRHITLT